MGLREGELWLWSFETNFLLFPNLHAWESLVAFLFHAYLKELGKNKSVRI